MSAERKRLRSPRKVYPLVPVHRCRAQLNVASHIRRVDHHLVEIVLREYRVLLSPGCEGNQQQRTKNRGTLNHFAHVLSINDFKISSQWLRAIALVNHIKVGSVRQVVAQYGDTAVRPSVEVHVDVVISFSFIHERTCTVEYSHNVGREV